MMMMMMMMSMMIIVNGYLFYIIITITIIIIIIIICITSTVTLYHSSSHISAYIIIIIIIIIQEVEFECQSFSNYFTSYLILCISGELALNGCHKPVFSDNWICALLFLLDPLHSSKNINNDGDDDHHGKLNRLISKTLI